MVSLALIRKSLIAFIYIKSESPQMYDLDFNTPKNQYVFDL